MASLFQRIVLVALVTCVGLFAGLVIGAAFFVPPDSGLAGPAIVVVWGLGAAVLTLVGSAVTVKRLEPRGLRRALVIASAIVAAIVVWIGFRLSVVQAQSATPPQQNPERVDLLTFAQGAVPVSIGGSGATLGVSFEAAIRATDGNPLGFALTQKPGAAETDLEFVYQLPASTVFDRFAVPNVLETPSPNVTFTRLVEVHGSTAGPTNGFTLLASATLSTHQKRGLISELTVHSKSPVRWVKLRLVGGIQVSTPQAYFEFSEIVGNGTQETPPLASNFRGVWKGRGVLVELQQDGPLVNGCYDRGGQLTGTVSGNILRATGVAQVNRVPSAFILNVGGDGGLRGVRSTNGGPSRFSLANRPLRAQPQRAPSHLPYWAAGPSFTASASTSIRPRYGGPPNRSSHVSSTACEATPARRSSSKATPRTKVRTNTTGNSPSGALSQWSRISSSAVSRSSGCRPPALEKRGRSPATTTRVGGRSTAV